MYRNLEAELARKNWKRQDLSKHSGIKYTTLLGKMNGDSDFLLDECIKIRNVIDKKLSLEYLFKIEEERK